MQRTSGFSWDPQCPEHPRRNRAHTGEDVSAGQTVEMKAGQAKAEGKAELQAYQRI